MKETENRPPLETDNPKQFQQKSKCKDQKTPSVKKKRERKCRIQSHSCNLCSKSFPESWRLKRHIRERHSKKEDTIFCQLCGSTLKNKSSLEKHLLFGSCEKARDKQFPCFSCGKRYRSLKYLRLHTREIHPNYKECPESVRKRANACEPSANSQSKEPVLTNEICLKERGLLSMLTEDLRFSFSEDSTNESTNSCSSSTSQEPDSLWLEEFSDVFDIIQDDPIFSSFPNGHLRDECFLERDSLSILEGDQDTWSWLVKFR